ncbi:MAG: LemA family protein [Desulfacinum sp.]|jgi:LemA protein|nr:LemA family protein [Desulfacinum sp.]
MATLVIGAVLVLVLLFSVVLYNRLVRARNLVEEAWSGIDVQLKRRTDLIPNLVETVRGYVQHERGVLEEVTAQRTRTLQASSVEEREQAERGLGRALGALFAVAENYPDLKANQNFLELQQALADIENEIQLARRYYNGTVRDLNILVESFPSNLFASLFGFRKARFLEIEEGERAVPKVSFS